MARGMWLAVPLACLAAPAAAQVAPIDTGGDQLCFPWRGTIADQRNIAARPVPDSYRTHLERQGACRSSRASLTDWHLAFGDARSSAAALAFLEERETAGRTRPAELARETALAWRDVRAAVSASPALRRATGEWLRWADRLRATPPLRRGSDAVETLRRYRFVADEYLRAAQTYRSPEFLDKAATYFVASKGAMEAVCGAAEFATRTCPDGANGLFGALDGLIAGLNDLETRIAVMRADLSRSQVDIAAAAHLLQGFYDPAFADWADAERGSGHGCAIPDEGPATALHRACGTDGFSDRARGYWRNQAYLELIMAADPEHFTSVAFDRRSRGFQFLPSGENVTAETHAAGILSFEDSLRFLRTDLDRLAIDGHFATEPTREAAMLLLAYADMKMRLAGQERGRGIGHLGEAYEALMQAERLSPPYLAPARFRRVAETFLALWERNGARAPDSHHPNHGPRDVAFAGFVSYLRRTLDDLNGAAGRGQIRS